MAERVETQDLTIPLALSLAGLAAAILAACALLIVWVAPEALHPPEVSLPAVVAPALQISPRADMARFRAEEEAELSSYGWVDRDRGVVRIPIDQAMEKVVRQGIPGWPEGAR
jgi:hypothetical protein